MNTTDWIGFIGVSILLVAYFLNLSNYLKKKRYDVYGVDFDIISKVEDRIFDINLLQFLFLIFLSLHTTF